jgi:hypothetical protein
LPTGDKVRLLSRGGRLTAVSFSADGRRFATAGEDRRARIWDAETGRELLSVELPDAVVSVALSPDGTQLATGGANGVVRVLALRVDDLVRIAHGHVSDGATTEAAHSVPDVSGPRGAFRVSIGREDLLRQGIPSSAMGFMVGDYTLALIGGSFWLHSDEAHDFIWQTSGTYTISGDRITFTNRGLALCAGNVVSARWRSRGAVMTLSDVRADIVSACEPDLVGPQFHAVFTSHPWRIVGGAMGG